jgi:molybdopterin biosynthesis enzyme
VHDDGKLHIENASRHGSHLLSAVADANALAMVPDGDGLAIGEIAQAIVLEAGIRDTAPPWPREVIDAPGEQGAE